MKLPGATLTPTRAEEPTSCLRCSCSCCLLAAGAVSKLMELYLYLIIVFPSLSLSLSCSILSYPAMAQLLTNLLNNLFVRLESYCRIAFVYWCTRECLCPHGVLGFYLENTLVEPPDPPSQPNARLTIITMRH